MDPPFFVSLSTEKNCKVLGELTSALPLICQHLQFLSVSKKIKHFDKKSIEEVQTFLNNPIEWSAAHGGASAYPELT